MNLEFSHRLFYQSLKTKNNPYIKKVNISAKDIQNIYRNIYLVNDNETFTNILADNNVIIQTPQQVNFNQPVLDLFLNTRFGQQIMPTHILDKLNKNWIFYQTYKKKSLEKNIPIYVFTIDFLTGLEMYDVFKYLNINYIKYKKREQVAKEFLNHCAGSLGFLSVNQNFILMIFHNAVNKKTIAHQLCHYFQEIIGVYQSQVVNIDSGLPNLQLTKEDLIYLLDKKQFYPHILIDMIRDFQKFYYIKFNNIPKSQYINFLLLNIQKYSDKIFYSNFGFQYKRMMHQTTSLQFLAALYYLKFHYQEVKEILIKQFKK